MAGPYYSYRVHSDMVRGTDLQKIAVAHQIVPRLLITPLYIALLLAVTCYFPLEVRLRYINYYCSFVLEAP